MAGNKPQAHPHISDQEYAVAAIAGLGLLLAILAGMLDAFGSSDNLLGLSFTYVFVIGIILIAIALVLWWIALQPSKEFDDLQTPYYTGHDHHHDEAHAAEDHHEIAAHADEESHAKPAESADGDDLAIIEGIGPKAKAALYAVGIRTFQQVAQSDEATLNQAVGSPDLKLLKTHTWKKQAEYIVNKDAEGFENYKKSLKSGTIEDLEKIEGIGPKVKAALVAAGIQTFAQLASADVEALRGILQAANLKLPKPDTWPTQAQFLVEGDVAGFTAYTERLKGGVDKS